MFVMREGYFHSTHGGVLANKLLHSKRVVLMKTDILQGHGGVSYRDLASGSCLSVPHCSNPPTASASGDLLRSQIECHANKSTFHYLWPGQGP